MNSSGAITTYVNNWQVEIRVLLCWWGVARERKHDAICRGSEDLDQSTGPMESYERQWTLLTQLWATGGISAVIFEISSHCNEGISDLSIITNNTSSCQKAGFCSTLDPSAQHGTNPKISNYN